MDPADATAPARLRTLPSWLLNQLAITANRLVADRLASGEARRHHYAVLTALAEVGPASQAELGRRTTIDRSDMVAAVNDLAGRGWVARSADPADRRRNVVSLTPAGRHGLATLDRLVASAQDELLAGLSPDERARLTSLLAKAVGHHARA
jgi:MarR family transcriptional regulator, lower aerobic nicotinate degradation pathway regulator